MMHHDEHDLPLDAALRSLGAELRSRGSHVRLLVVGGASLILRGIVARPTGDVDVLARVEEDTLVFPHPLDPTLQDAALAVARNLGLPADWLNATVARSWSHRWPEGLPTALLEDAEWRRYGTLDVGLAGRRTLVALKLHAVADRSRVRFDRAGSLAEVDLSPSEAQRHLRDLAALAPTEAELQHAAVWVKDQDTSPHFHAILRAILDRVRDAGA